MQIIKPELLQHCTKTHQLEPLYPPGCKILEFHLLMWFALSYLEGRSISPTPLTIANIGEVECIRKPSGGYIGQEQTALVIASPQQYMEGAILNIPDLGFQPIRTPYSHARYDGFNQRDGDSSAFHNLLQINLGRLNLSAPGTEPSSLELILSLLSLHQISVGPSFTDNIHLYSRWLEARGFAQANWPTPQSS
ncbi:MAG: hypothetical protein V1487_00720 [bacterium]